MKRRTCVLLLFIVLLLAVAPAALAQEKALYWQRYDVDITILQSGDFRVVETQELVFTSGTFRYGQREILINRFRDITGITVAEENGPEYEYSESDAPYTYRYYQDGSYVKIRYNFPASTDTRRTIVIGYTIVGGLRYYPEDGVDQLFWKAIPDGNPFPTQSSTITLHAPEGATLHQLRDLRRRGGRDVPTRPERRNHQRHRPPVCRAGGGGRCGVAARHRGRHSPALAAGTG